MFLVIYNLWSSKCHIDLDITFSSLSMLAVIVRVRATVQKIISNTCSFTILPFLRTYIVDKVSDAERKARVDAIHRLKERLKELSDTQKSLKLSLQANQTVTVEAGAMAAMDACIAMKSKMKGGLGKGIGRMLGGESLFTSEFTAEGKAGDVYVSPGVPGDIKHYALDGRCSLMVQSSGFVAAGQGVAIDSKFQGFKGFFSGESLFLLKVTGEGDF